MVLCLPHSQSGSVSVPTLPKVLRVVISDLLCTRKCWLEVNQELILPFLGQLRCDIDTMGDKHVITLEDLLAIKQNCGISVQAIEGKDIGFARSEVG